MRRARKVVLAIVLAVTAFLTFAALTNAKGEFDPSADAAIVNKRVQRRLGLAAADGRKAAKTTKKTVVRQQRKLKKVSDEGKREIHRQYKAGLDEVQ